MQYEIETFMLWDALLPPAPFAEMKTEFRNENRMMSMKILSHHIDPPHKLPSPILVRVIHTAGGDFKIGLANLIG